METSVDMVWILGILYHIFACLFVLLGIDDLCLDFYAWFKNIKPHQLSAKELMALNQKREKKIAIIIPAWKEAGIIGRMVAGNIAILEYKNYEIYIGVYPNDIETVAEVTQIAAKNPQVHAVINDKNGPTTKGQMLNCVIKEILKKKGRDVVDAIQMQDAEDLMHPKILKLINLKLNTFDFIQTPVFSLENRWFHLVGGSYMDEFAEGHTKDVLIRSSLGAAVPSAGVGTTISRKVLLKFKEKNCDLFNERSLTEDYELGLKCKSLSFKCAFICSFFYDPRTSSKNFIATREYFPNSFKTSIKQKTRWAIGINLQGWQNLKWYGSFCNRYFLYRDRKGIFANMLVLAGYTLFGYSLAIFTYKYFYSSDSKSFFEAIFSSAFLPVIIVINIILMINRLLQRIICVIRVYGILAIFPIIFKWPISCVVNGLAAFNAMRKFLLAKLTKKEVIWNKTTHRLPTEFGHTSDDEIKEMVVSSGNR